MPGNIARTDPLRPRVRLGTPNRSVVAQKSVADAFDASSIRGNAVSTLPPVEGQTLIQRSGQYVPESPQLGAVFTHGILDDAQSSHTILCDVSGNIRFAIDHIFPQDGYQSYAALKQDTGGSSVEAGLIISYGDINPVPVNKLVFVRGTSNTSSASGVSGMTIDYSYAGTSSGAITVDGLLVDMRQSNSVAGVQNTYGGHFLAAHHGLALAGNLLAGIKVEVLDNVGDGSLSNLTGIEVVLSGKPSTAARWLRFRTPSPSTFNSTVPLAVGLDIDNLGGATALSSAALTTAIRIAGQRVNTTGTVKGIEIAAALTGATRYGIHQLGTSDFNVFAGPTLIGADATAAAGTALELRGGALRMAASTNNYIQDSAGLRHITFASDSNAAAVTTSLAGDLRINGNEISGSGGASRISFDAATYAVLTSFGNASPDPAAVAIFGAPGTLGSVPLAAFFVNITDTSVGLFMGASEAGGMFGVAEYNGAGAISDAYGAVIGVTPSGSGVVTNLSGAIIAANVSTIATSAPTNWRSLWAKAAVNAWSTATRPVTSYGLDVENQGRAVGTGTAAQQVTTIIGVNVQGQRASTTNIGIRIMSSLTTTTATVDATGLLIQAMGTATTKYGIRQQGTGDFNVFAGRSIIGVDAPPPNVSAVLELQTTTGALLLSRMTTTQRDALTAVNGMGIYNSTTAQMEKYQAGAWVAW